MDCPTCLKSGDKRGDSDLIWGRLRSNIILLKGKDLKKKKKLSFPNFCKLIQIFFVIFFVTSRKKNIFFRPDLNSIKVVPPWIGSGQRRDLKSFSISANSQKSFGARLDEVVSVTDLYKIFNLDTLLNFGQPLRTGLTGMILPLREAV